MPELHFRAASPLRTHFRNPLAADVAADPSNPKWVQLCTTGKYVYRGQPIDIAAAVLYFASPAASWVSGKILDVDGMAWPEFIPKNIPDLE